MINEAVLKALQSRMRKLTMAGINAAARAEELRAAIEESEAAIEAAAEEEAAALRENDKAVAEVKALADYIENLVRGGEDQALVTVLKEELAELESQQREAAQRLERLRTLPELLERTHRTLVRLERLVGDLLDVARISAGQMPLHAEPADLATIVREAVREERESNPGRAIRLQVPSAPVPVFADAEMLVAAVGNYIGNAIKYSREDQPVEVTLRVEPEGEPSQGAEPAGGEHAQAVVAVRDFGPGLTPEQQRHIWERFYRAEIAHQSGSGVGLGLGLYITKSIVERHGGSVGVSSELGAGSTFFFTIPLDTARDTHDFDQQK